jgi:hypothetical protein
MVTNTQVRGTAIVSAQVDAELRDELLRRAEEADRSLSAEIRRALQEHLNNGSTEET